MKKNKFLSIMFIIAVCSVAACDNEPLLTELNTSRLKIVLKGTYASHGARAWDYSVNQDESIDDYAPSNTFPTLMMLDIAEIRLNKDKISNYRQTFTVDVNDSDPFFNGTGIELKTDDPKPDKTYSYVKIYIRKMIFNHAYEVHPTGSGWGTPVPAEVVFHENDVEGFDFNQRMPHCHWDTLREDGDETNRIFPIKIPIAGGFEYDANDEETVLEIRLNIKNFIELFEYEDYDEGEFFLTHYFSVSDWIHDVHAGEDDLGGNLIGAARAYVPGKTGSVTVNGSGGTYLILVPVGSDINDYVLNNDGATLRNAITCDLPVPPEEPGSYVEQYLDYYLKYEQYKIAWNTELGTCPGADEDAKRASFEAQWDSYIDKYTNYALPPIAVLGSGSVFVDNIPPGDYELHSVSFSEGELPTASSNGTTISIVTGDNGIVSF